MKADDIDEANSGRPETIIAAERGEEVTITRHGAPVARPIAVGAAAPAPLEQRTRVQSVMQQLRQLGADCELICTVKDAIAMARD